MRGDGLGQSFREGCVPFVKRQKRRYCPPEVLDILGLFEFPAFGVGRAPAGIRLRLPLGGEGGLDLFDRLPRSPDTSGKSPPSNLLLD